MIDITKEEYLEEKILSYVVKKSIEYNLKLKDKDLLEIARIYIENMSPDIQYINIYSEKELKKAYDKYMFEIPAEKRLLEGPESGMEILIEDFDRERAYAMRYGHLAGYDDIAFYEKEEKTHKL